MAADEVILFDGFERLDHGPTYILCRHGGFLALNTVMSSAKIFVGGDKLRNLRFEVGKFGLECRNNFGLLNCVDNRVFATSLGWHFF